MIISMGYIACFFVVVVASTDGLLNFELTMNFYFSCEARAKLQTECQFDMSTGIKNAPAKSEL